MNGPCATERERERERERGIRTKSKTINNSRINNITRINRRGQSITVRVRVENGRQIRICMELNVYK